MKRLGISILLLGFLWSFIPTPSNPSSSAQNLNRKTALAHFADVQIAASPAGALIQWRTSFELDTLGFNIYRETNGARTQVNPSIIAGVGQVNMPYQWVDREGTADSVYYLEQVDLKGESRITGPYLPIRVPTISVKRQARLLAEVDAEGASQTEGPQGTFDSPGIMPGAIEDQWMVASQPALKIGINQSGWYRVTQAELAAAGFNASGESRNLRLFVQGREVPIRVSRDGGALGASDYLEFYASGVDTATTDTQVYYLINGTQSGLRIRVFGEIGGDTSPVPSPSPSVRSKIRRISPTFVVSSAGAGSRSSDEKETDNTSPRYQSELSSRSQVVETNQAEAITGSSTGFLYEVQQKDRFVYFTSLLNGAAENFFGLSIANPSTPPTTKTLTVTNLQTGSQGTALLKVGLQGTTLEQHLVNILVNDSQVGSISFAFQQYGEQTFNVPVSLLREGANEIKFVVVGGSNDRSLFSYVRLTFPRNYRAQADALSFAVKSNQSATVEGFTTPNVRVLDVSDPAAVKEVVPIVATSGSGYSLTIASAGAKAKGTRALLALPATSFQHPFSISLNQPSTLNQAGNVNPSNSADLVIITHQSFIALPALATLVAQRQAQGYTVKVIDVEDIFDEFGYGAHTAQAITDFLARARINWTKPPRYLLLLGDASYDYRNYLGFGSFDLVPTKLLDTGFPGTATALETGSDDALADFDGDGIPEIAVGRLPVRTVAEANIELAKLTSFSPSNVPQTALMVADAQGTYYFNFEQANENLIPLLPSGMQSGVDRVYRRLEVSDSAARANIISKINQGTALVNYSGHGTVDVWTGAPIFSTSDAVSLTNGNKLPLVIVMDCLNGYFLPPALDSVGEALLKAPNGGAIASFASSGLTIPDGQHEMGQRLFQLLYSGPPLALGDATRQAKAATSDIDVRRSWILFGDPTLKIR